MATEVICIVDTDGTQSPDYTSLAAAIAGETGGSPVVVTDADLVTNDEQLTIKCRASSGAADTSAIALSGFTTDATRYVNIYADVGHRHSGIWDTDKYRLQISGATPFVTSDNYWRISHIQYKHSPSAHFQTACLLGVTTRSGNSCVFSHNLIWAVGNYSAQVINFSGYWTGLLYNNLIINDKTYDHSANLCLYTSSAEGLGGSYGIPYFYNNTFIGGKYGIDNTVSGGSQVRYFKNNIVKGQMTQAWLNNYNTSYCGYNASDDTSSTGSTGDRTEQSFTFEGEGSDDYRLASGDTGAKDYGTDLSGTFSDDIAGNTRSGSWDIGAFEYVSSGISESIDVSIEPNVNISGKIDAGLGVEIGPEVSLSSAIGSVCSAEIETGINLAGMIGSQIAAELEVGLNMPFTFGMTAIPVLEPGVNMSVAITAPISATVDLEAELTYQAASGILESIAISLGPSVNAVGKIDSPIAATVEPSADIISDIKSAVLAMAETAVAAGLDLNSAIDTSVEPGVHIEALITAPVSVSADVLANILYRDPYLLIEIIELLSGITTQLSGESSITTTINESSTITTLIDKESLI